MITTEDTTLRVTALTAKGNEYEMLLILDPYKGRKGDEILKETCGKCGGDKVINWGNVTLRANGVEGRVCFECRGTGYTTRKVSSARSTVRRQMKAENERRAEAADWAAEAPAREAAEKAAAEAEAKAEAERLAAKPKGHLGAEGERLRNLNAKVTMIRYYESVGHYGQPVQKCIVKFDILGKVAVWFTDWSKGLEEGDFVSLTGTVKDHSNRDGEDQTILTRCTTK